MLRLTRRRFLQTTAAASAVFPLFTVAGTKTSGQIIGANEKVRVGVAGINGRGKSHMGYWSEMKNQGVDLTHLIDPDSSLFESRQEMVRDVAGNTPKCVQDIREALDDENLDAISIASCNHWHALLSFWACQAGKDVYVEKPASHNVFEGRQLVRAAEKYGRIVQHGTNMRAEITWHKQAMAIASGQYGKLLVAKGWSSKSGKGRRSLGFKPYKNPPPELDFNIWLGPAPLQRYHENIVHYNWHWFWDFGNGEIGNQGVHQMDIARWGIPGGTLPKSVISLGGRWVESTDGHPPFTDQAQTPNCQMTVMDFGGPLLVFEVVGLVEWDGVDGKSKKYPRKVTNEYFMEEGVIKEGKFFPNGSSEGEDLPDVEYDKAPGSNFENFIACVRSRDRSKLYADVLEGHYSAACCHLGNISYRTGEQVPGDVRPDVLKQHSEVEKSFDYIQEVVKNTLHLDLTKNTYQLGKMLTFDPATEKFVGDDDANKLLTRDYREPFVVTEDV